MPKWAGALLFALMAVLFVTANSGAYKSYFHDDDLDNIAWTGVVNASDFSDGLISPHFSPHHFRPAGHFYYWVMGRLAGMQFPWYVAVIHAFHLLNVLMLWFVIRRLAIPPSAAVAGILLFAYHMAVFNVYWRPMYIFDVLCASFCLLCLLCYVHGRWVLSLVFLWVAYKAKEQAVMLPLVLAAYELWIGQRRWKRLIPFFAVALSFGLQGIFRNPYQSPEDVYALRLAPSAVWKSVAFYSSRIAFVPYAGLALLALPVFVRDRRLYFGLAAAIALLVPMLLLPGRLFAAYLYVPLIGVAITIAALMTHGRWTVTAAFVACWLPINYLAMRINSRTELARADETRMYVSQLSEFARNSPGIQRIVFAGRPSVMERWGVEGALHCLDRRNDLMIRSIDDCDAGELLKQDSLALLTWNPAEHKLYAVTRPAGAPEASYITMDRTTPFWLLGEGWCGLEDGHRWIQPRATAGLMRPPDASQFELIVNVPVDQIMDVGRTSVRILLDGRVLGQTEFARVGEQKVSWKLPPGEPGPVQIEFLAGPEYRPPEQNRRVLGAAIEAFGFVRR